MGNHSPVGIVRTVTTTVHYATYGRSILAKRGGTNELQHKDARQQNHHDIGSTMVPETTTNPLTLVAYKNIGLWKILEMIDVVIFQ